MSVAPRYIKKMTLYNMIQDYRHLLICDYRKDFEQLFIRDSYSMNPLPTLGQLIGILQKVDKINVEKEAKYKMRKIRRVVLVFEEKTPLTDERIVFWQKVFDGSLKDYKLMVLQNPFAQFATKYPFLCHSRQLATMNKGKYAEDVRSRMVKMMENQKNVLYSFAKFPTEIIEDKLFVGNIYNSNSQMQLNDLKIKALIDLVAYNEGEIVPEWKKDMAYYNIPLLPDMGVELDFDQINRTIDQLNQEGKTPILIYCKSGQTLAPGFAIAYLMYKAKLDVNTASLKVFQATSTVEIAKWLYTKLLVYNPVVV